MKRVPIEKIGEDVAGITSVLSTADLRQALSEVRRLALQGIRDNFTSSSGPLGKPWPPRRVAGDGHPLLMDSGDMLQAAVGTGAGHVSRQEPRSLELGVSLDVVPYAAAQNYGYGPGNLPQREYLGVKQPKLAECDAVLANFIDNLI